MPASTDYSLTYAVGDIHGRLDLLERAIDTIGRHGQGLNTRIVFLGDYIDRGPDSRGVLQRLISLQRDLGAVCLKGNHEDMMIRAFTSGRSDEFDLWSGCGSQATLRSYGLGENDNPMQAVPWDHVRWLARLPLTAADPHRIYVHAGLAPRRPFREQTEATLLWIREAFLRAPSKDFEQHVVHGHTPLWRGKPDPASPEILPHRSNLDTAAFATGVLTIGVFDRASTGGPVEVLSVQGEAAPHPLSAIIGPREPPERPGSGQPRRVGPGVSAAVATLSLLATGVLAPMPSKAESTQVNPTMNYCALAAADQYWNRCGQTVQVFSFSQDGSMVNWPGPRITGVSGEGPYPLPGGYQYIACQQGLAPIDKFSGAPVGAIAAQGVIRLNLATVACSPRRG